jgi:hypothetical protein
MVGFGDAEGGLIVIGIYEGEVENLTLRRKVALKLTASVVLSMSRRRWA